MAGAEVLVGVVVPYHNLPVVFSSVVHLIRAVVLAVLDATISLIMGEMTSGVVVGTSIFFMMPGGNGCPAGGVGL